MYDTPRRQILSDTLPVNGIGPQWWIMHSSPFPPP